MGVTGTWFDRLLNACFSSFYLCKHIPKPLILKLWKCVLWERGYYIEYELKILHARYRLPAHVSYNALEFTDHMDII